MAGYSGKPLAARLGIRPGLTVCAVNAPADYAQLLAPLPDGARITRSAAPVAGLVHHFATGPAFRLASERMRLVRQPVALRARLRGDEHAPVLDLQVVRGNTVLFVARLPHARLPVELVVMPGADDVVTVEMAPAERAADVVADAGNRSEAAILEGQGDTSLTGAHFLQGALRELLGGADVDPLFCRHVRPLPRSSLRTTSLRPDQVSDTAQTFTST